MGLCDRFHCLPSQLLEEDAELLRMVAVVERGRLPEPDPMAGVPGGGW